MTRQRQSPGTPGCGKEQYCPRQVGYTQIFDYHQARFTALTDCGDSRVAARKTGNVSFITAATTTPDRNVDHADDSGHTTEGNQSEVTPEHQEASESGHNPASTKATQDHAEKLRSEIEAHLTDQQIDAIRAQVQAKPLEALAQEILSTL